MSRSRQASARRAAALSEYAILLAVVSASVLTMQPVAKRGLQAAIKMTTDRLSPYGALDPDGEKAQVDGMRYEAGDRNQGVVAAGTVLVRKGATRTQTTQQLDKLAFLGGSTQLDVQVDQVDNSGALTSVTSPVFGDIPLGPGVSSYSEVVVAVDGQ